MTKLEDSVNEILGLEGQNKVVDKHKKAHYDYVWDNKQNNYKKIRQVEQLSKNNAETSFLLK